MKLEQLQVHASIRGIVPDALVAVVSVQWFGSEALELTYKTPSGKVANELLYRHDEPRLELMEQGRPWSFDGDGALFRLVSEAQRIRLAHLFDPVLAVHTSIVDPLPHQITAVYEAMLPRQPLRFLLADDPGAGKTIMAGLLIKELIARDDLQRCLIVCPGSRREFVAALKTELPQALAHLQAGNIAPVDLAQAAIGPGMAVYTRYAKVLDAEGKPLPVRAALALINQTLDEALAEQEGDFDSDSRWALAWFEQMGFNDGEFGVANVLAQAKNTGMDGLVEAGIIVSGKGKVHLLRPAELPADWDPSTDKRLTVWEMVHQLIRVLEAGGEGAAAELVAKLGSQSETARELCYRLYTLCERKKRATEALAYNGLVQSWPEITRLAREEAKYPTEPAQAELL